MLTLVLGGQRSGKSAYAESLAKATEKKVIYLATAKIQDEEMRQRIALHQQRRPSSWRCIEEPVYIAQVLSDYDSVQHCVLIDCLGLWLCNFLEPEVEGFAAQMTQRLHDFTQQLNSNQSDIIMVSPESSLGIIPISRQSRLYIDTLGQLNQQVAQLADKVVLVMAGLPRYLKG